MRSYCCGRWWWWRRLCRRAWHHCRWRRAVSVVGAITVVVAGIGKWHSVNSRHCCAYHIFTTAVATQQRCLHVTCLAIGQRRCHRVQRIHIGVFYRILNVHIAAGVVVAAADTITITVAAHCAATVAVRAAIADVVE